MLLELKNVTKKIKDGGFERTILENINLPIDINETVALVGTSGSGKTALLRALGFLECVTIGEFKFQEAMVSNSPESALANLRRKHVGYIGFEPEFLPNMSVIECLKMPISHLPKKEQMNQITDILNIIGLVSKIRSSIDKLQYYERVYISAARAFIKRPDIVVGDNPGHKLHSNEAASLFNLISKLQHEYGGTFIFSTYDPEHLRIAGKIVYMKNGNIVRVEKS